MFKLSLSIQIIVGLFLGVIAGLVFGPSIAPLSEVGKLIIQLIKVAAIPLLFFAIVHAILKTEVSRRSGLQMITIAIINGTIALCIGLGLSNIFKPGSYLNLRDLSETLAAPTPSSLSKVEKIDFLKTLGSYFPTSIVQPFADNAVIPIVIIALLLGFGMRHVRKNPDHMSSINDLETLVGALLQVTEIVLHWIIRLVPLAVFSVVARAVGEYGFKPLQGLAVYVGIALLGMALHILITYQANIRLVARMSLKKFWKEAREPVIYAAGANSSLATLPITLKSLKRLGVSKSSSTLGACVGTNLNNDGIILYEAMAVLFVAQAHGITLTIGQQVLAAAACMVAAMGVAGIPEAGFISLSLVLATVGLPLEILPLLLTVDWIVARARSITNVLSDMVVSTVLDRFRSPLDK